MSTPLFRQSHCLNSNCPSPRNSFGRDRCEACDAHLLLSGRFRLGERLQKRGQTGTSLTYVFDEENSSSSPRLLKALYHSDSNWYNQFQQESKLLRHLFQARRQAIIRNSETHLTSRSQDEDWLKFDYWESGIDCPVAFVMDYLPGRSLAEELRQKGSIPWVRLRNWLPQLIQLVYFLHRNQIIHGDIKPGNLILDQDRLHIVDFGAAGHVGSFPVLAQGSPGYCPTRIVRERLTYQRDWCALGRTCIELLTGHHPVELIQRGEFSRRGDHSNLDWQSLVPQISPSLGQRMNTWMTI
ncbi:MAG: serine/threonine protein kinase [Cyanophyceae cyanobacterium]